MNKLILISKIEQNETWKKKLSLNASDDVLKVKYYHRSYKNQIQSFCLGS